MSKARDLANAGTALGAVTATELGYVDGVTSAIQTQIDAKEATLPSQTGNSGKYLTTNGSAKSWGTVSQYALPSQTGNSGKYLTTDGSAESWGIVSAGGMTLLSTTTLSGSVVEISSISQSYNTLVVDVYNCTNATNDGILFAMAYNGSTQLNVNGIHNYNASNPVEFNIAGAARLSNDGGSAKLKKIDGYNFWRITIPNYASTTSGKGYNITGGYQNEVGSITGRLHSGYIYDTLAVDKLYFTNSGGSMTAGTVKVYGVN